MSSDHRYDSIIDAIRDGMPDDDIKARYSDMDDGVLAVYHKIIDGSITTGRSDVYGGRHNNVMPDYVHSQRKNARAV